MGPPENLTGPSGNQERGRKRPARLPRTRRCLLKGCERRFRPRRARERYCSLECRRAARSWSCWKAQQSYRATAAGRENRQGQSRRYRERVRTRQPPAPDPAVPPARVITTDFFRPLLRSSRLLPGIRATAEIAAPTILFARVPAGHGTRLATRTPLAPGHAVLFADSSRGPSQIIPTY
jgi:hypothetical protein